MIIETRFMAEYTVEKYFVACSASKSNFLWLEHQVAMFENIFLEMNSLFHLQPGLFQTSFLPRNIR